jgi:beta-apo-4'-carotenal oxygenase
MNDGFFHASIPTLPFGGVGTSGQGAYRGKASFDVFTHRRSVTTTPAWLEGLMDVRYPPYTAKKMKKFAGMNEMKPNFDREGRTLGWGSWFLGLLGLKSLAVLIGQ